MLNIPHHIYKVREEYNHLSALSLMGISSEAKRVLRLTAAKLSESSSSTNMGAPIVRVDVSKGGKHAVSLPYDNKSILNSNKMIMVFINFFNFKKILYLAYTPR